MFIKLYYANVSPLKDAALYEELYAAMPRERQSAADRLRFEKDRRLSVGAFALLKRALEKEGEREVPKISYGEHGKPYFPDREGIFFNLSHSADIALCAIADAPVGCDVEKIGKPPLPVAKKYFSPAEREYVSSAETDEERAFRFYRVWTLNESVMKATGLGFSLPPSSFSVVDENGKILSQRIDGEKWTARDVLPEDSYCFACCAAGAMRRTVPAEKVYFSNDDL